MVGPKARNLLQHRAELVYGPPSCLGNVAHVPEFANDYVHWFLPVVADACRQHISRHMLPCRLPKRTGKLTTIVQSGQWISVATWPAVLLDPNRTLKARHASAELSLCL